MSGKNGRIRPVGEIYQKYKGREFLAPELGKQGTRNQRVQLLLMQYPGEYWTHHVPLSLDNVIFQIFCQENKLHGKTKCEAELQSL